MARPTNRHVTTALACGLVLLASGAPSSARAGILIANAYGGEKQTRALTVVRIEAVTVVDNQVAHTTLTQTFRNDTGTTVEGLYVERLPEDAGVISFAHWVDGKRIAGTLQEKEQARQTYADAQQRETSPALLEMSAGNKFEMKLDNIAPGAEKKIELIYSEMLAYNAGTIAFRLPLAAPVSLRGTIEHFSFTMTVKDAKPITSMTSPWTTVHLTRGGPQSFSATCARDALPMDEDLPPK